MLARGYYQKWQDNRHTESVKQTVNGKISRALAGDSTLTPGSHALLHNQNTKDTCLDILLQEHLTSKGSIVRSTCNTSTRNEAPLRLFLVEVDIVYVSKSGVRFIH